jgi:type II secretory pathway component PulF
MEKAIKQQNNKAKSNGIMKQKSNKKPKQSLLEGEISIGGVSLAERAVFAKNLAVMLKSGLTITAALEIAYESAQGKLKKILQGVLKSVEAGRSLSSAFSVYPKVFSGLFINATKAGESSGTLEENLDNIAKQLEKEKELSSKIKGAMLYPIVVLIATFALGMVLSFVVLPKITPLFEGLKVELPITTRGLIWFSHVVQDNGIVLFLGIIAFIIFMSWLVRQKFAKPVTHKFLLYTPIIKRIVRNVNIARFCRTLGTLLKSGLNIDEALEITKDTVGNYYFQTALADVSKRIGKGTKLSENLKQYESLFPVMVTRMINVGEESGKLDETLLYLAHYYEIEVDTSTKSLSTAIEPILLIFIGLVVGFLALSIITPIYDITGNIKR